MDTEVATTNTKPKNKGGRPRKHPLPAPKTDEPKAAAPTKRQPTSAELGGWPIEEGFSWITVYPTPPDLPNKKHFCGPWIVGDRTPITFLKGTNVCLPNAIINSIKDSVVQIPEDVIEDGKWVSRHYVDFTRFPHSDPIPATAEEFAAYRKKQSELPHPNTLVKK